MRMQRAFQIILAVLATIAVLALLAASVLVFVPIIVSYCDRLDEGAIAYDVITGIYEIFNTEPTFTPDTFRLTTTQLVVLEGVTIFPLMLLSIACVLLYRRDVKTAGRKVACSFVMLGMLIPAVFISLYADRLFGNLAWFGETTWIICLFITAGIAILYMLLSVLTWIIKPAQKPVAEADEQTVLEEQPLEEQPLEEQVADTQQTDNEPEIELDSEVAEESIVATEAPESEPIEEAAPVAPQNPTSEKIVRKINILCDLHDDKVINDEQFVALTDYVMDK